MPALRSRKGRVLPGGLIHQGHRKVALSYCISGLQNHISILICKQEATMKEVFAYRLRQARIMKGLSMDELCQLLDGRITKQSIYKYEKASMLPDSTTLLALADALDVDADFLFRPVGHRISNIEFRKKSSISKRKLDSINSRIADSMERLIEVEDILNINEPKPAGIDKITVKDDADALSAARTIRERYDIGMDAIVSTGSFLEDNGFKVIELREGSDFDGLSGFVDDDIPFIAVNDSFPSERIRFTSLHELGHIVLDIPEEYPQKDVERLCHIFAGEMLLPSDIFSSIIGAKRRAISLQELIPLQMQYGISIPAMMHKAEDLGIISESHYRRYCIRHNSDKDFRQACDESRYMQPRNARLESLTYRALSQGLISESKAAALLNISVEAIRKAVQTI